MMKDSYYYDPIFVKQIDYLVRKSFNDMFSDTFIIFLKYFRIGLQEIESRFNLQ